jgi:hypothetical protein
MAIDRNLISVVPVVRFLNGERTIATVTQQNIGRSLPGRRTPSANLASRFHSQFGSSPRKDGKAARGTGTGTGGPFWTQISFRT